MLKRILFFTVLAVLFSCKGDNDDEIFTTDTLNIDFETGIVFGTIDPLLPNETAVYKFTSGGLFLATNANGITSSEDWMFSECPFSEDSLTYQETRDVENVARGVRIIPSTDISETISLGDPFYVLEYVTEGERKTIQYYADDSFNEEQIQTYLDFLRETIQVITLANDPILDCL